MREKENEERERERERTKELLQNERVKERDIENFNKIDLSTNITPKVHKNKSMQHHTLGLARRNFK